MQKGLIESIAENKFQKNLVGNLDFLSKILFVCLFIYFEREWTGHGK